MNLVPGSRAGKMILLTPSSGPIPDTLRRVDRNPFRHNQLLKEMQRLRGRLYLEDGAISPSDLSADGCHRLAADAHAFHLLALDRNDRVYGCARYVAHPNTVSFSQLGIKHSALAESVEWGARLRKAVQTDIEAARRRGVSYVEVGGWALAPELRCTVEALRIALASYSLARVLGGCVGIGSVTRRHCSASIVRRIGGMPLAADGIQLPDYFDPQYGCQMEMLRFDSAAPNPRFEVWVDELRDHLLSAPTICAGDPADGLRGGMPSWETGLRSHPNTWRPEALTLGEDLVAAV